MVPPTGQPPGSSDEQLYLRARLVLAGILFTVAAFESLAASARVPGKLLFVLAGIFILGTLVLWASVRRDDGSTHRLTMILVVPDLIVVAGLSYVLHGTEDAFYPLAVLLPVAYALMKDRHTTWYIGIATAMAYAAGHLAAHRISDADLFMFLVKTAAIPLIAAMVASSVDMRRQREREAERAVSERETLNRTLERRLSELQAVSEITDLVHSSLDFEKNGPVVLEILSRSLAIDTCSLMVVDKERSETLFSAGHGALNGTPVRYGRPESAIDDHLTCLSAFDSEHVTVLFCAAPEDIDRLSTEDRLVLNAVASELVVAVENTRLYRLTKKLAVTDELTGLANYRQLQQKLDEEIERAKRYGKRVSLIMLDIDDFKTFNDTHGHVAGDVALGELGRVVAETVREVDLVARYGGEEFSVVLPETDAAGAFVVAEKVREAVQNHRFADATGHRCCDLTVSIGVASYPAHATGKDGLLREADHALYRAKTTGKNWVRTPSSAPSGPVLIDDDLAAEQTGA